MTRALSHSCRLNNSAYVKIKISYVTEKNLKDLPEWIGFPGSCKYCIYWEFPHKFKEKPRDETKDNIEEKSQWLKNVRNEFGVCAIIIHINEKPIGYAQYAPPTYLPNTSHYSVLPSPDAVLISCLFIFDKRYRRQGFGTILLNAVIENLENRNITTIETIAMKNSAKNPSGPVEFYLKNGFRIYNDDKKFPLMRFDL